MHKYILKILVPSADEKDHALLHEELTKESFTPQAPALKTISVFTIREYRRKGNTLKDINDAVFRAARRAGKKYSFTVMKEKTALK